MNLDKCTKRNAGIDLLRGFAILSVILLHLNSRIKFSDTYIGGLIPNMLYKVIFWSGFYGVCIFFVISGFLITTSALTKWGSISNLNVRTFYAMRFARIIPLLATLLVVLSLLHATHVTGFVINPGQTSLARSIFAALTFHINWLEIQTGYLPASWDVLWSLSIEETFYIFLPLLCIVSKNTRNFVIILLLFMVISPYARTAFSENDLSDRNHLAYMDAIAMGCIAAIVTYENNISKFVLRLFSLLGLSLITLVVVFRKFVFDAGLVSIGLNVSLLALGTALVLITMQKGFESGEQSASKYTIFIRLLGRNSYEVYLTHMFVVLFFTQAFHALNLRGEWIWLFYALTIGISGFLGEVIARNFSNPANKFLRNKLIKN